MFCIIKPMFKDFTVWLVGHLLSDSSPETSLAYLLLEKTVKCSLHLLIHVHKYLSICKSVIPFVSIKKHLCTLYTSLSLYWCFFASRKQLEKQRLNFTLGLLDLPLAVEWLLTICDIQSDLLLCSLFSKDIFKDGNCWYVVWAECGNPFTGDKMIYKLKIKV